MLQMFYASQKKKERETKRYFHFWLNVSLGGVSLQESLNRKTINKYLSNLNEFMQTSQ